MPALKLDTCKEELYIIFAYSFPDTFAFPITSKVYAGLFVPIPTYPPVNVALPLIDSAVGIRNLRSRLLPESPMNISPEMVSIKPLGLLNLAKIPSPSTYPAMPLPATVVTTPSMLILRILLFPESATYIFPVPSSFILWG